jgi:hypothetical protein
MANNASLFDINEMLSGFKHRLVVVPSGDLMSSQDTSIWPKREPDLVVSTQSMAYYYYQASAEIFACNANKEPRNTT